ncbi:hypothetical protein VNO77_28211 [Canavalia gladiata]|uniref:Uncharacterized protein n=1 Tax=Canavalia gladiata TaxID=3824 RepID=A0AAN9KV95_CANGL
MGKSSSSLKKKRSKNSSKVKASSRSKSRKYKSKKVRRKVSLSSSDYDDSKSLDTSASSSSDDGYRRKRNRSRTRKDVKGRKKRAQRRSYSRDSSEDSHYARKRKKVKRKNDYYKVREKPHQKKKIRREASVSPMSSRSWSCSTCQEGSANSDDSQYESRRGRSERKEKDRRLKGRSGNEKSSRYRARSCSSCSASSESSYERTDEKFVGENNSRWLRSVITVTKEVEESGDLRRNEAKEEIVDDHDYPCKSTDSNDGGTKRELDHPTLLASEEQFGVEDEMEDMNADLNFTDPKLRDRSHNDSSHLKANSAGANEAMKKETIESSGANLNGDDLESVLRIRALENLRKFRGKMQSTGKASDQKNKIISQVKQPITDKLEQVRGKSIVTDVVGGTKFDKQTPLEETDLPVVRRNLTAYPRNNDRTLNIDKVIDADNPSETVTESTNHSTRNLGLTTQTQKSCHDSLQTAVSHEPANAKYPVTEDDRERNVAKTTQAAIQSIDKNDGHVDGLRNSGTPQSRFEGSSVENKSGKLSKLQDESNQGSQFEQKTMNVMRGGEMVQVSYKVYIPNKVPALARRQLKR